VRLPKDERGACPAIAGGHIGLAPAMAGDRLSRRYDPNAPKEQL
jgi:hypothetical protein